MTPASPADGVTPPRAFARAMPAWRHVRSTALAALAFSASARAPLRAQQPVVVNEASSRMPSPRVAVSLASPRLLRVVVAIDSLDVSWLSIQVRTDAATDSIRAVAAVRRGHLTDTTWLAATPGARYAVSARLESPVVRQPTRRSAWSAPVDVVVPPAPSRAPASAFMVGAKALSPHAIEVSWQSRSAETDGYAIEFRAEGDSAWRRITIVNGVTTDWTHHALRPGTLGTYRVVAFNEAGVAAPSATVRVGTPRGVASGALLRAARDDSLESCVARAEALAAPDEADAPPTVIRRIPFGRHVADMRLEQCGNANCVVTLLAVSRRCYRPIARLFFVAGRSRAHPGWVVFGTDRQGWPVLGLASHLSASSGGREIVQYVAGRYRSVDAASVCGDRRDVESGATGDDAFGPAADAPLERMRPPFRGCQFDVAW